MLFHSITRFPRFRFIDMGDLTVIEQYLSSDQ